MDTLIPSRFLFRPAALCPQVQPTFLKKGESWASTGLKLPDACRLQSLVELEGRRSWADVRAGWCDAGLAISLRVAGKKRPPSASEDRPFDSDALEVWIDTRDTHNVHRASRFCHHFVFLPIGGGRKRDEPLALQFFLHRARENAPRAATSDYRVRAEKRVDGYVLEAFISSRALTGYDPAEHPRLGFHYAVRDAEHGSETWCAPEGFPYREDPSLWGTLELVVS